MGKKSRKKRERRHGLPRFMEHNSKAATLWRARLNAQDASFLAATSKIRRVLSEYHPHDVLESLLVSELWLPNRSSQIKHILLIWLFISIDESEFLIRKRTDSYTTFVELMSTLYAELPQFPMMEDYVPEEDWGEVKMPVGDDNLSIFYGGVIERVADFIEGFRVRFCDDIEPMRDMDNAIRLQHHLIQGTNSENLKDLPLSSGHLEMPSEGFWSSLLMRLRSMNDLANDMRISEELITNPGVLSKKLGFTGFAEAVHSGTLIPFLLVKREGRSFPVSPRNMPSVVIDYWMSKSDRSPKEAEASVLKGISHFLKERFPADRVRVGPFLIVTREIEQPLCEVAAFFTSDDVIYIVVVLHETRLAMVNSIEQRLSKAVNESSQWGFLDAETGMALSLRRSDSEKVESVNFRSIVVISGGSTVSMPIRLPRAKAEFIFLSDFITIFDSVKSIDQFLEFLKFRRNYLSKFKSILTGWSDIFAAYKDSSGVLIDGAVMPNAIFLDPHWGSNWRYEELAKFWAAAPTIFPNDSPRSWLIDTAARSTKRMISKVSKDYAESVQINECTLFFVVNPDDSQLDPENARYIMTFTECVADSVSQRASCLSDAQVLKKKCIVTVLVAKFDNLIDRSNSQENLTKTTFDDWKIIYENEARLVVAAEFNLNSFLEGISDAKDSSFEAKCAEDWLSGVSDVSGHEVGHQSLECLRSTRDRMPRFSVSRRQRTVDLPVDAYPENPKPRDYKLARRDLAHAFKRAGVAPGSYELEEAKRVIDPVRDQFRSEIHASISSMPRMALVRFCLEQFEAQIAEYDTGLTRLEISTSHEVEFDRAQEWVKIHSEFLRQSRNTRYLIECALSMEGGGSGEIDADAAVRLLARIDWMIVLYDASDSIHNDVNAGGIDIDSEYVPQVFYLKEDGDDGGYQEETGRHALGYGIVSEDEYEKLNEQEQRDLNAAFKEDVGFEINQLLQLLSIAKQWHSIQGRDDMRLSYSAPIGEIIKVAINNFDGLSESVAEKIVEFLTIKPDKIRLLAGKGKPEGDVPIWEHRKRIHRLTIRPFIPLEDGSLLWGAGSADRAFRIWVGTLSGGYLPSDFAWPSVISVAEKIKNRIELEIEDKAGAICKRFTSYYETGLDLKSRFPKEIRDEIGDYDVLAFWPAFNRWVMIECKYNKPPYALKDARRLREQMFDPKGQHSKIVRRRKFLEENHTKLRMLLGWPEPADAPLRIDDLYVSPHLYYWMRNPPYSVTTQFVKLGALDTWLRDSLSE
ncbi:MAG: hypothetical protein KA144_01170 [Xanthomonadaceae bacterium]|nr:hypothetical protein [Xanthomonadaceae bacterium]